MVFSIGDRLGVGGLIVAFIALGVSILWPDKKWIGWISLSIAGLLFFGWIFLEGIQGLHKINPIFSAIIIFLFSGCLGSVLWILLLPKNIEPITISSQKAEGTVASGRDTANSLVTEIPKPTLASLFSSDLPNTMKVSGDLTMRGPDGKEFQIKRQVYLDFPAKTQFIGFYIQSFDNFSNKSYEVCLALANAVQQEISNLPNQIAVRAGYKDEGNTIQDLTFSGRVLLYHEDFLSITQKAEIIRVYKTKNYDVQFRGIDYLGDQVAAWHRQHDPKSN